MKIPKEDIVEIFRLLNEANINYALITNNGNELPDNLSSGKDIDILVSPTFIDRLEKILLNNGYIKIPHPKGKQNGWNFSYGTIEHQKWKKNNVAYDLELDIQFQLVCQSLQPKMWIPLDTMINESALPNRIFNEKLKCYELDDETRLIYLIVRCVFDKNQFSDVYIEEIEKRSTYLTSETFKNKMRKIFFNFTGTIITMLQEKKYSEIIHSYITFRDY